MHIRVSLGFRRGHSEARQFESALGRVIRKRLFLNLVVKNFLQVCRSHRQLNIALAAGLLEDVHVLLQHWLDAERLVQMDAHG